jgi:drug/metabolite transporter (DMT)-like permease
VDGKQRERELSAYWKGALSGLGSAALFGLSAPLAKLLLPRVDPWLLAGLLYFGAGAGLTVLRLLSSALRQNTTPSHSHERLRRGDLPLLVASS